MSMNLYCKEVNLRQTPTYITYLCYYADLEKYKKASWRIIRDRYLRWLYHELLESHAHETLEDAQAAHEDYNDQELELKSFKKLHFEIL
jgi:hypothetical protein